MRTETLCGTEDKGRYEGAGLRGHWRHNTDVESVYWLFFPQPYSRKQEIHCYRLCEWPSGRQK